MDQELATLEARLAELLERYRSVRLENQELRARLGALENDKRRLEETVLLAAQRVEAVLARLPEA